MHQRPNFASRSPFCQRLIPCTSGNISFSSLEANTASLSQQGANNTKSNCVSPAVPCCFLSNSNTNGIGRPLVRFLLLSTFTTDQHLFQSSRNRAEWWLCLSLKERIVSLAIIHFVMWRYFIYILALKISDKTQRSKRLSYGTFGHIGHIKWILRLSSDWQCPPTLYCSFPEKSAKY